MAGIEAIRRQYDDAKRRLEQRFVDKIDKLKRGDELPPGVMKMVKVVRGREAQDAARRQDGRTARK